VIEQDGLFEIDDEPASSNEPVPVATILVHFATREDRAQFERDLGQRIPRTGRGQAQMWYPRPPDASFGEG